MARVRKKMVKSIVTIHREMAKKEIRRMIKENDKMIKEKTDEIQNGPERQKEETKQEQSN